MLYIEDINNPEKKREKKLLHLVGPQLQEVAYNLPDAIEQYDAEKMIMMNTSVDKLSGYFLPRQNSTFERHIFRNIRKVQGENLNKFLLRQQSKRCHFGNNVTEAAETNMKDKIIMEKKTIS